MNSVTISDNPLIEQARQIIENNLALSEEQKKDVLLLLTNDGVAKIKIAEFLMEGKNMIMNGREYNEWLDKVLAFSKHVYGDAPQRNINLELKVDLSQVIEEAYKKRVSEEAMFEVVKDEL